MLGVDVGAMLGEWWQDMGRSSHVRRFWRVRTKPADKRKKRLVFKAARKKQRGKQ